MVGTTSNREQSFEDGSSRSWIAWAINRGGECVRFMWQG